MLVIGQLGLGDLAPLLERRQPHGGNGGALAGLAGAYMSLAYTPLWAQDMTAGRGWVAVALVTFSAWRPLWLLIGAWFFGALMYLSLYVQALGVPVPSALVPSMGWVDFDPTNRQLVNDRYVVTAWGRDYSDVPPFKGVIFTEGTKHDLEVLVDVVRHE